MTPLAMELVIFLILNKNGSNLINDELRIYVFLFYFKFIYGTSNR